MQESWQVFMKPTMSAPHVDAAFQAGAHTATTSMAGRVMFPFPRWSEYIGETNGGAHGKRTVDNLVAMAHTTTNAVQNPAAEGHRDCKVSSSMVDATQLSTRAGTANGLVCTTEAKKAGDMTATQENFGATAMASCGSFKADGHNATAFSASPIGKMAQINQMMFNRDHDMNYEQELMNSKNEMQIDNKILLGHEYGGGVSNSSKCKQQNHPTVQAVPRCQIDGCKQDLSKAKKEYHRRHKVCEMHSKASSVLKCGLHQRFCQQCSRFHVVGDFDDAKRSCRRRLEGHNRRRRKSISQGYGNLVGMNPIMQHQLIATAAMMAPLQQQVFLNQGKSNNEATNLQQIQYEQKLAMLKSNLPAIFDERILSFLTYNTMNPLSSSSSSSSSSSPSSFFNHGDTTCALSLLSCHASLDQPLNKTNQENHINPNLSSNLTTTTFPNTTNLASMININANNSIVIECPPSSQSIHPTIGKVESFSFAESTKDLLHTYPLTNYLKNMGPLQSFEQLHNANLIAELARQHKAYSNPNPYI